MSSDLLPAALVWGSSAPPPSIFCPAGKRDIVVRCTLACTHPFRMAVARVALR
ncbi:hypothetical protein L0F63_001359 [Massospora cicadina]|nr:hypothetical protein L0F63_001359 [Massospora cicadina]